MLLNSGDKVLIIHRRIFEGDRSRFFIGQIDTYETGIAKVKGFSFAKDPHTTVTFKKNEERTKIFSLSSGTLLVYQLGSTVDLNKLNFETSARGSFFLKEGEKQIMDLNEIPHNELSSQL